MTKFLLTCKPWQLFFVLVGAPILVPFLITAVLAVINPELLLPALPVMAIVSVVPFFSWFYALATNLYPKLPAAANLSMMRFKSALFFPLVYLVLLWGFMLEPAIVTTDGGQPDFSLLALVLPLHLLSMVGIFYAMWFTAKALKSVELQAPAQLSSYLGEFFMLWFFPIGIWALQPRINHLFSDVEPEQQFQPIS